MKDKLKDKDCEIDRNATLEHMKNLLHKWRGSFMQGYIKPTKTKERAMEKVPRSVSPEDWKWLLDEHFFNEDFLVCWLIFRMTLVFFFNVFPLFFLVIMDVIF